MVRINGIFPASGLAPIHSKVIRRSKHYAQTAVTLPVLTFFFAGKGAGKKSSRASSLGAARIRAASKHSKVPICTPLSLDVHGVSRFFFLSAYGILTAPLHMYVPSLVACPELTWSSHSPFPALPHLIIFSPYPRLSFFFSVTRQIMF